MFYSTYAMNDSTSPIIDTERAEINAALDRGVLQNQINYGLIEYLKAQGNPLPFELWIDDKKHLLRELYSDFLKDTYANEEEFLADPSPTEYEDFARCIYDNSTKL